MSWGSLEEISLKLPWSMWQFVRKFQDVPRKFRIETVHITCISLKYICKLPHFWFETTFKLHTNCRQTASNQPRKFQGNFLQTSSPTLKPTYCSSRICLSKIHQCTFFVLLFHVCGCCEKSFCMYLRVTRDTYHATAWHYRCLFTKLQA